MKLSNDYKNIVKLRFSNLEKLDNNFFDSFYVGIEKPNEFNIDLFEQFSLQEILYYLKKSHIEYLTIWFPKLENLVNQLQNEFGVDDLTLTLQSFIVNYYNELSNHINFEEKVLYNFVEKLLKGVYIEKEKMFVLNHFLETHNHDVSDDLGTIQKVLLNKNPDLLNNPDANTLFEQMSIIQNDLTLHSLIEDEILMEKIHTYIANYF